MTAKLKIEIAKATGELNELKEIETALSRNKRDRSFLKRIKSRVREAQDNLNYLNSLA